MQNQNQETELLNQRVEMLRKQERAVEHLIYSLNLLGTRLRSDVHTCFSNLLWSGQDYFQTVLKLFQIRVVLSSWYQQLREFVSLLNSMFNRKSDLSVGPNADAER